MFWSSVDLTGNQTKDDDGVTVWNNIEVHSALQTLKALVKDYYNEEIALLLFEYEFLE